MSFFYVGSLFLRYRLDYIINPSSREEIKKGKLVVIMQDILNKSIGFCVYLYFPITITEGGYKLI